MESSEMRTRAAGMETPAEDKITQLLDITDSINTQEIQEISAERHDALYSAWAVLDAKLQEAAPVRARRMTKAAAKARQLMGFLRDGRAKTIGDTMGISDEPYV